MEKERIKKLIAVAAIILATAMIAVSVVALGVTNSSNDAINSQNESVQGSANSDVEKTISDTEEDSFDASKNTNTSGDGRLDGESDELKSQGNSDGNARSESASRTDSYAPNTSASNDAEAEDNTFFVYLVIDRGGHGNVDYADNVTLEEGASVYDALLTTGISVNARDSQYGIYVASIGGLPEKSAGGESGWKYSVNRVEPSTACSNYKLKRGDVVKWKFVTKANEAVG